MFGEAYGFSSLKKENSAAPRDGIKIKLFVVMKSMCF